MRKIRAPFSVSALGQAAALAALHDEAAYRRTVEQNALFRAALRGVLQRAGLESVPSQANFVLVPTPQEAELTQQFAAGGVMVRPGTSLGLPGTVRITVPGREGLARVAACLKTELSSVEAAEFVASETPEETRA